MVDPFDYLGTPPRKPSDRVNSWGLREGPALPQGGGRQNPEDPSIHIPGHPIPSPPPVPQQAMAQQPLIEGQYRPVRQASGGSMLSDAYQPVYAPSEESRMTRWIRKALPWQARWDASMLLALILLLISGGSMAAGWYACKHAKCG